VVGLEKSSRRLDVFVLFFLRRKKVFFVPLLAVKNMPRRGGGEEGEISVTEDGYYGSQDGTGIVPADDNYSGTGTGNEGIRNI